MNLRDKLKRVEVFSRDQRYIVFATILQAIAAVALLYYTPYQLIFIPFVLVLNYFLLARVLISKKRTQVLARAIRPSLWLILLYSYLFSVHVIFLVPVVWFIALTLLISIGYASIVWQEIQIEANILVDNILSVVMVLFGISFCSLLLAYWHWPTAIVMLVVWLISFFIATIWLLDFTDRPQLLAAIWALMCVELFWISSRWINLYQLPKTSLLLSQAGLVIAALAYGFGGIYYHHKNKTLKKSLIFEYISVTAVVFVALILLSKWAVAL